MTHKTHYSILSLIMTRQSPINITKSETGSFPASLHVKFSTKTGPAARNTGGCLHVDTVEHVEGKMSGGPLEGATYSLQQFHFHWGDSADKGAFFSLNIPT